MRRSLAIAATLACALGSSSAFGSPRAPRLLTGFLATPTDQLSVPGALAGAEITPEGDLYTGWAEYELRFGGHLRAWNQPTRTLPDPGVPLLSSTLHDGPVLYTQTVFAVAVGGRPVAYETVSAANRSPHARWMKVAMEIAYTRGRQVHGTHGSTTGAFRYERPAQSVGMGFYNQPGEMFSPAFAYSVRGRDLDRSGLLLARGPDRSSRPLGTLAVNTPTAAHDGRLFEVRLKAHSRIALTWKIPLQPPRATMASDRLLDRISLARARRRLERMWRAEERGMTSISVPEARVSAAYRASVLEILGSRYRGASGWVQTTNKLQYQSFWLRDAALQTQALDLVGLHTQAAQNLAFLAGFQRSDGLFISRSQQYDGWGQALWTLAEHAQLTGSPGYATAQLGRMQAAIVWLSQTTALEPLGLLPAGDPGDDELAFGHITGDDLWAAAGLRSAISDATLAGRADLAAAWQAVDNRFEAALARAIAAALARAGHIPPVLDGVGGQDWGNYYAAYPVQVLPASSSAVSSTLAWAREHMVGGVPTYNDGHSLHGYLGFPLFQTELEAGDAAGAVAGLYAELAHTTSTYGGWEWSIAPFGFRGSTSNLSPHGTFAADYIALLRNLLVEYVPGGTPRGGVPGGGTPTRPNEVRLLGGASPAWLAPGRRIAVRDAPTEQGSVSFTERSSAHGETLRWRTSLHSGALLVWVLPPWARHARLVGGGRAGSEIVLPSRSGVLSVTFDGHRPAQSYLSTVVALNALYRAHGERAPLVSASR
ncbi:MAG: hypothetical protein ACTHM1_04005 [Solirubrobacteraceae bacterium]